jgi:hypothetical protein
MLFFTARRISAAGFSALGLGAHRGGMGHVCGIGQASARVLGFERLGIDRFPRLMLLKREFKVEYSRLEGILRLRNL